MITLVGVGHVFDIKRQVREVIVSQAPRAVAIELDKERFYALQHPQGRGNMPVTYRIMSKFQRRLADEFGGQLGGEMLSAADTAKELSIDLLFIDADAGVLFGRLMSVMPVRERVLLFLSAFTGLFASRKKVEQELEKFTQNEDFYMKEFARQFPTLKRVLIDERNQIMANNLMQAEAAYGNVVAIVGDGHVEGIGQLLQGHDVRVVRLKQLFDGSYPKDSVITAPGNAEVSYQYTVDVGRQNP